MKTVSTRLGIALLLTTVVLSGCESGGGGEDSQAQDSAEFVDEVTAPELGDEDGDLGGVVDDEVDGETFAGAKLTVTGESNFAADGTLQLLVSVADLTNDDAVFLSVKSEDLTSGAITATPQQAVIYPTDGDVSLTVRIKNNALVASASVQVNVVTSDNLSLLEDIVVTP